VLSGMDDEDWYDEQLHFLLERMLAHRDGVLKRIESLQLIRPATRYEVHRRISAATDYLHSHYRERIDLGTLARVACLSKYHFLRLFTQVHGITPQQYLLRKRTSTALRLLRTTSLDVSQVASRVGFTQRHALLRQMQRWTGLSPRRIRQREVVTLAGS
jgi:AraC family transcriptional regulator